MQPIFARIYKVDEATRTVYGRAAQEVVDRDNELFDYASSKPEFQKWSAEVFADTAGKSYGNVRSMHGNIAAGKLTEITFEDAEKAIDVAAKIIDNNEWTKCIEGVHTGFSIGGRYARKWSEPINGKMVTRYTAVPSEISIVDRPCIPTAKFFSIHKRDGSVIEKEFVTKGGPGSGPHPGGGKTGSKTYQAASARAADASDHAFNTGNSRNTSKEDKAHAHANAALAHQMAGAIAGRAGDSTGKQFHAEAVAIHTIAGQRYGKSDGGQLVFEFVDGKVLFKGGPGSGPHPGGGKTYSKAYQAASTRAADASEHAFNTGNSRNTSKEDKAHAHANAASAHQMAGAIAAHAGDSTGKQFHAEAVAIHTVAGQRYK